MKYLIFAVLLGCACAYPYYPYYTQNVDSVAVGAGTRGAPNAMVLSRYYQPYQPAMPRGLGSMAAFMYGDRSAGSSGYVLPSDSVNCVSCQDPPAQAQSNQQYPALQYGDVQKIQANDQSEVIPQASVAVTVQPELADATDKNELVTSTGRATPTLEIAEVEEIEEEFVKPTVKPSKKRVTKKKRVQKPQEEEIEEEADEGYPGYGRFPMNAYFPMFFGYPGSRGASGGGSGGPTAVANAYSTGRGGVATSHATAYGGPRPDSHR